jgi:mono/diheme cytochrome c family protein
MKLSLKPRSNQRPARIGTMGTFLLSITTVALACSSVALAQNEDKAKAGLEVWKSSGCSDCHGAFANGERERDESPTGANLRTARLDAAALKKVISCGRVGAEMPAFIAGPGSAPACSGQGTGEYPAPRTLTSDEIDLVVAYLQARIVGHGRITKAECMAYYDNQEDMCVDYR